jgi:hypothetical protein
MIIRIKYVCIFKFTWYFFLLDGLDGGRSEHNDALLLSSTARPRLVPRASAHRRPHGHRSHISPGRHCHFDRKWQQWQQGYHVDPINGRITANEIVEWQCRLGLVASTRARLYETTYMHATLAQHAPVHGCDHTVELLSHDPLGRVRGVENLTFTGLTQNLGQLWGSYRDFQLNYWVNLRISGQPCEFYLDVSRSMRQITETA